MRTYRTADPHLPPLTQDAIPAVQAAIMTIWLFLGTKNWIEIHPGAVNTTLVREPGADPSTVWNPFIIRTDAGRYYVQCEDPYDSIVKVAVLAAP